MLRYAKVTFGFAAFFTVFFSPALFGGNYLTTMGDGSNIALPAYLVPHGWWEPNILLGYPWASNFNGGWDPLFLLHVIPNSFNAYMLAAYVIAAVGAFGCVDTLTRSTIGGIVAGLAYALGGFMIGHLGHYDIVHAAAWTPVVFWALLRLRRDGGWGAAGFGALAIGLCALGGQPQVLAYTLLFALAYVLVAGVRVPGQRRFFLAAITMFVFGIGLGAIALAPGLFLTLASFRAQPALPYFLAFSLPVWQIPVRLLLPYVAGMSNQPLYPYSTAGIGDEAEFTAYVGIATLTLALIAVMLRRTDRNTVFFCVAALAALVLSAGDGFHIAALTFHIPLLNLFRAQARFTLIFTLFAAILSGLGVAEIVAGRVPLRAVYAALAVLVASMALAAAAAVHSHLLPAGAASLANPAFFIPIVLLIATGGCIIAACRMPAARITPALLVIAVAVDVSSFAWFAYWRTPVTAAAIAAPPIAQQLHAELATTHQRIFAEDGATTTGIPPNLSLVWGVPEAGGYVSLLVTAPGIFLQLYPQGTMAPDLFANPTDRSLDFAAVRYIIASPAEFTAALAAHPHWRLRETTPSGVVLENTRAEPRVRVVHRVIASTPDAALAAIREGTADPGTTALVQDLSLDTPAAPSDTATIAALDDDRMLVHVVCGTACFLVTSDAYNSNWVARIDGKRTALHLTNYALRGVAVPAGTHDVSFTYRPWIIYLGAGISLFSATVILGLLLSGRRDNRAR